MRRDTRRWIALPLAGMILLAALSVVTRPRVLHQGEGAFGEVLVVERWNGLRELYAAGGRSRQTALHPDRPGELEIVYTRVAMAGVALVPRDARILFVGLGGGAMPRFVRHHLPDARVEVVELDPEVVRAAREWFAFPGPEEIPVHVADGRAFLEAAEAGTWDLVVLDAFSGSEIPRPLTTRTFLEAVRSALAPGGVVASNLHTSSPDYLSMLVTYQEVFPQVVTLGVPGRRQRILLAAGAVEGPAQGPAVGDAPGAVPPGTRTPPPLTAQDVEEAARGLASRVPLGFDLPSLVRRDFLVVPGELGAPVLRDPGAAGPGA